jgi:hypothetical protein
MEPKYFINLRTTMGTIKRLAWSSKRILNQMRDPKFPLHVMVANIQRLSIHIISILSGSHYLCQHDSVVMH